MTINKIKHVMNKMKCVFRDRPAGCFVSYGTMPVFLGIGFLPIFNP